MPYERACFILGITTSGILSGTLLGVSVATLPSLLAAPPGSERALLHQFEYLHGIGGKTSPSIAALSALLHLFNAYSLYHRDVPLRSYKFIAGATAILAIIPWTHFVLGPVIRQLQTRTVEARRGQKARATEGFGLNDDDDDDDDEISADGKEVRALIQHFAALNWVRAGLVTSGTLLAFIAL